MTIIIIAVAVITTLWGVQLVVEGLLLKEWVAVVLLIGSMIGVLNMMLSHIQ